MPTIHLRQALRDAVTEEIKQDENVFFMGERVPEPADHPVIFPSINAMAETYRLASERPDLGGVTSPIAGVPTNRFLPATTPATSPPPPAPTPRPCAG